MKEYKVELMDISRKPEHNVKTAQELLDIQLDLNLTLIFPFSR